MIYEPTALQMKGVFRRKQVMPTDFANRSAWSGSTGSFPRSISAGARFVMIIAGEASGDLHGSNLVKAMRELDKDIEFMGIGGKRMAQAGVEILFSASEMSVVGLTEVWGKLGTIVGASRRLKSVLKNDHPDLLILIDYPDFNLHMAGLAKRFQVPVLYYISPQVWAWRKGRVRKIVQRTDRMAVILPFEEKFYAERGVEVDYVGHPILDACPSTWPGEAANTACATNHARPVVGLLPGSRKEEIRSLLPCMIEAAEIIKERYPDIRCFLPLAETVDPAFVESFLSEAPVEIHVTRGDIYDTLRACHVAFVASGTATLETAIMGVPMVIVYKVSRISYWVGKMIIKVPHIGLVNLVAGEEIVPELIQGGVTAERVALEALKLLEDRGVRADTIKKLAAVRQRLGGRGASERTAKIALEMMKSG